MSVKNLMNEVEGLMWNTIKSCAALYGFSAEEAWAKIDLNGNLICVVKANVDKEAEKALKEAEKAEKMRLKEAEKALKEAEKAEKLRLKEAEKAEKTNESSENSAMKEEEVLSKAVEKAEKLRLKEAEKALKKTEKPVKKTKKSKKIEDLEAQVVVLNDEEPMVRFQNVPLLNEINSIRDVKKSKNFKKLSKGVKLARQILDI